MNLGLTPWGMFILSVIGEMVRSGIGEKAATQYAAMQYDYFRNMKDQEITDLVFELSREFPKYKYWEWYNIVDSLRKYGALEPPPDQQISRPETGKASTAAWIAVAVVAVLLLMEIR